MTFSLAEGFARASVGVKGAVRWATAVATGDMADDATVAERRAICRECPSRVRKVASGALAESDWCGEPLVDRTGEADAPTCGCLLQGATSVASKSCPQGKWVAVTVRRGDAQPV